MYTNNIYIHHIFLYILQCTRMYNSSFIGHLTEFAMLNIVVITVNSIKEVLRTSITYVK